MKCIQCSLAMLTMGVVDLLTALMLDFNFSILEMGGKRKLEIAPMGVGRFHVVVSRNL